MIEPGGEWEALRSQIELQRERIEVLEKHRNDWRRRYWHLLEVVEGALPKGQKPDFNWLVTTLDKSSLCRMLVTIFQHVGEARKLEEDAS